ncbi:MAG: PAS domain-containing protein [Chlamydiia bacterium]|nr:PAS domain-containing protein [Chlamydiia bacterium]
MKPSLKNAQLFAEAIARLLHPFAEVVLHDLEMDLIEAIYNPLSRREVGDHSYLDRFDFDTSVNIIGPYGKTNWDGRSLKSISVVIRGDGGQAEGFLCVNVDTSAFESVNQVLRSFLGNDADLPEGAQQLFKDDYYEKINIYVRNYCRERQVSLDALGRVEKQEIIKSLEADGAFKGKNAAVYVSRVLGISRATVYNYLKEKR